MSDEKPTLKPCPFCGSYEVRFWGLAWPDDPIGEVSCERCDAGTAALARDAAIAAWNRRATPGVTVPAPLAT